MGKNNSTTDYPKIQDTEKKVSSSDFRFTVGGLAALFLVLLGGLFSYVLENTKKCSELDKRVTIIETQMEERKNKKIQ